MKIFLTGATGMVGSSLLPRLAKDHEVICLARGKRGKSAIERVRQISDSRNIKVLEGDVTLPNCGLSEEIIAKIKRSVDKIVHCAASVRFDESAREEIWAVNDGGTRNLLKLATNLGVKKFYHTSTAYIAGDIKKIFTEKHCFAGQNLRNPYEASKLAAEQSVRSWQASDSQNSLTVFRPSILVGDWETGETFSFDGYYGFFRPLWGFKKNLAERKTLPHGVYFDDDTLNLRLHVQCSQFSTINLIPRNWVVGAMEKIINNGKGGKTYHLVHPNPPKVEWVIEKTLFFMGISGVQCGGERRTENMPAFLKRIQRRVDAELRRYSPYVNFEAAFGQDETKMELDDFGHLLPVSEEYLHRLISYAMNRWEAER